MKTYKYIGLFKNDVGHTFELTVHCNGLFQAFILLTADAIREGKHYQLDTITDENANVAKIGKLNLLSNIVNI
jgi:hypothetical protein